MVEKTDEKSNIIKGIMYEFLSGEEFDFHPLADMFDLMDDEQLEALGRDLLKVGQIDTIDLHEGKILDGRNRYKACKLVGKTPRYRYLSGIYNAKEYVISKNLKRRHLTPAKRAELALELVDIEMERARKRKLATLKQFRGKATDRTPEVRSETRGKAVEKVAKREHISKNTIYTARKVRELNVPKINESWGEALEGKKSIKSVRKEIQDLTSDASTRDDRTKKREGAKKLRIAHLELFREEGNKTADQINTNSNNNPQLKLNIDPISNDFKPCRECSKASVIVFEYKTKFSCTECSHLNYVSDYISRVLCDEDFIKGNRTSKDPYMEQCESAFKDIPHN